MCKEEEELSLDVFRRLRCGNGSVHLSPHICNTPAVDNITLHHILSEWNEVISCENGKKEKKRAK